MALPCTSRLCCASSAPWFCRCHPVPRARRDFCKLLCSFFCNAVYTRGSGAGCGGEEEGQRAWRLEACHIGQCHSMRTHSQRMGCNPSRHQKGISIAEEFTNRLHLPLMTAHPPSSPIPPAARAGLHRRACPEGVRERCMWRRRRWRCRRHRRRCGGRAVDSAGLTWTAGLSGPFAYARAKGAQKRGSPW